MNINEFARRVIELSPQIIKSLVSYEHNELTRGKITLPQFWALNYLNCNGKSKMNNLAKHLKISPAATTGLIDRLITQQLVARKDDSYDRRIVWIRLTSMGKNVIYSIRKQRINALIKVFSKLSSRDRIRYLNILEKVVKITTEPSSYKKIAS